MPELPEVETTARELRPYLIGRRFTGVQVNWDRTIATPPAGDLPAWLAGQEIRTVGRRGKFVVMGLASGDSLIVHLRMTGRLRVEPADSAALAGPHVRAWFSLSDGTALVFTDARKFGRIWLVADAQEVLGKLGVEPLEAELTPAELGARLAPRRVAIKALLLDQAVVAGLGNIYADEVLHRAGIHPLRRGAGLSPAEIERLAAAIAEVLGEAVAARGTTLGDSQYRPPLGEKGEFQERLRVYQRAGQPCPRCGGPIERIRVVQRSTHFCPVCQPADGGAGGPEQK